MGLYAVSTVLHIAIRSYIATLSHIFIRAIDTMYYPLRGSLSVWFYIHGWRSPDGFAYPRLPKYYPYRGSRALMYYYVVATTRCTTHFGVVFCWHSLSTGGARLTASLTRGYQSITPIGVVLYTVLLPLYRGSHYITSARLTASLTEVLPLGAIKLVIMTAVYGCRSGY